MSERLAIHGGAKAWTESLWMKVPSWPPVFPEVPWILGQVYNSRRWSFNGPVEQQFSRAFADYCGAKHGVFMVNGTATLECALAALGVKAGDEVIVPALTWPATAMAVVYLNAIPVFVDIEADTMCMDPDKVRKAITPKTKAIIPVHLYGSMADMDALMDISTKHGIPIIEDCAHAHGGVWAGKGVGSIGHVGSFSFQESKTLASGEGGLCTTNDEELAAKMYRLKHIGYEAGTKQGKAASGPEAGLVCHNYRGTEFQAAILLESLKHLKRQTLLRQENADTLASLIADIPGVTIQKRGRKADLQGFYMLALRFDLAKFGQPTIDKIHDAICGEGFGMGGTYGSVYNHMLWNVPKSQYRLADECSVADAVNASTRLVSHWVLLGDRSLMDGLSNVLHKVWANRSQL
jgi:L-glutamine:2-deoxy-scyllo-inosose/3-amino-2,3-dideoxy-scyllo-inosose aminotransferase